MSRNRLITLALSAGVLLRLAYLASSQELPFFDFPITDALFHHRLASAIASGFLWDHEAYFRAPLYYYLLGGLYALFGAHVLVGKIFGHVLGLVTGAVIIAWSDRLWGRRGAVMAALLWLGSGLLFFYEGELLVDSVFTCLLFVSLFLASDSRGRPLHLLSSGVLFGLAAITRPTALVCVPLALAWIYWSAPRKRVVWWWVASFVLPVAVVSGLNTWAIGRPTGIATSGGINFYIGNHEGADGGSATLPEPWGYAWTYRSLADHAAREAGRPLDPAEVSGFYYGKGRQFLREHPGEALDLWIRKAVLSVGRVKLSDNLSLPFVMDRLLILRLLAVWVALLFILAVAGLPLLSNHTKNAWWLWGFFASYFVVLVAYFTTDRFRLPLVPALLVLAAGTPGLWLDALPRRRVQAVCAGLVALVIALPNWYSMGGSTALAYFSLGNVSMRQGRTEEARAWYDSAYAEEPTLHQVRLNRGWANLRLGNKDAARTDFEWEARMFPWDARSWNNLAALHFVEGDTMKALDALDSGLVRDSTLAVLYLQRLRLALAWGDTTSLARDLTAARRHAPGWPLWTYWEAELAHLRGRPEAARRLVAEYAGWSRWPTLDPDDESARGPSAAQLDYLSGLTFLTEQRVDSAGSYFERAALADSSFTEAWSNWGTAAVASGDFEAALSRYRQALAVKPGSPLFLTNLAWAHLALGHVDSARAHLVDALSIDSTFTPAAMLLREVDSTQPPLP